MWTRVFGAVITLVGALSFLAYYLPVQAAYSPEQVCAERHPNIPREQCLAQISFAQSAGW
jgi:hypothetical protein